MESKVCGQLVDDKEKPIFGIQVNVDKELFKYSDVAFKLNNGVLE